ncbi:MAG TPA: aconitase X catalytic domain-containing protein [Jiangellaceae bacterium]|nr:aconitase X catalytic domain-containing protein [Jiangellaceae bacterium]
MSAPATLRLTTVEQEMLDGAHGSAVAMAMRIVAGVARAHGAQRLLEIESAHVDGGLYHGRAGLEFARRLADQGGQVAVRTTTNVGSLDLLHPELVRADNELREGARALMEAYRQLGCEPTWSCAPYQLSHRPKRGAHVAWAESNAIAFANSVLGARTERYGDFLDICAALTGRVPDAGLHQDEARQARVVIDFSGVSAELLAHDAAWPAMGALVGEIAGTRVAALTGLSGDIHDDLGDDLADGLGRATEDRLKALGATAASTGGVALFHVIGVTPEAPTLDAVVAAAAPAADDPDDVIDTVAITTADVRAARDRLSTGRAGRLDAVALGTPHFSVGEFAALAAAIGDGPVFADSVEVYVSTSRAVLEVARAAGTLAVVEQAGARIVTDTCTYVTPVLRASATNVMTNSGKWAWYAPGNIGADAVLGTLSECVASARAGTVVRDDRLWS